MEPLSVLQSYIFYRFSNTRYRKDCEYAAKYGTFAAVIEIQLFRETLLILTGSLLDT